MEIVPNSDYVAAWRAVNEANKSKMGYSSITACKTGFFGGEIEALYHVRRRGILTQMVHALQWLASPSYRERQQQNRHALLNMVEDAIRVSGGNKAKYKYNGKLKSPRESDDSDVSVGVAAAFPKGPGQQKGEAKYAARASEARKDELAPDDLPEEIANEIAHAVRNIGSRRAFNDALHRVFLQSAQYVRPHLGETYVSDAGASEKGPAALGAVNTEMNSAVAIEEWKLQKSKNGRYPSCDEKFLSENYFSSRQNDWLVRPTSPRHAGVQPYELHIRERERGVSQTDRTPYELHIGEREAGVPQTDRTPSPLPLHVTSARGQRREAPPPPSVPRPRNMLSRDAGYSQMQPPVPKPRNTLSRDAGYSQMQPPVPKPRKQRVVTTDHTPPGSGASGETPARPQPPPKPPREKYQVKLRQKRKSVTPL